MFDDKRVRGPVRFQGSVVCIRHLYATCVSTSELRELRDDQRTARLARQCQSVAVGRRARARHVFLRPGNRTTEAAFFVVARHVFANRAGADQRRIAGRTRNGPPFGADRRDAARVLLGDVRHHPRTASIGRHACWQRVAARCDVHRTHPAVGMRRTTAEAEPTRIASRAERAAGKVTRTGTAMKAAMRHLRSRVGERSQHDENRASDPLLRFRRHSVHVNLPAR